MKNRITAMLLMMVITVSLFSVTAQGEVVANSRIQSFVTRLAEQSASDRQSVENAVIPLLITNTGLDSLTHYINSYDPNSKSMYDVVVGKVLMFADKDMVLHAIDGLRAIDEGIREDCLMGFHNRAERILSPAAQVALEAFVDRQCSLYDGLEEVLSEDGITTGVISRLFEIPYKMNNSKSILTDNGNGFAINEVDLTLCTSINTVLSLRQSGGSRSADEFLDGIASWLNSGFFNESKVMLKTILADIGVYVPKAGNDASLGAIVVVPVSVGNTKDGVGYELIESHSELGYDIIEICNYINGVKNVYGEFAEPQVVKIGVNASNVMLYKIDDNELLPIKYCVYIGGELVCRVTDSGKYAVKIVNNHFNDVTGWGQDYIEALYNRGIISGKADYEFAPEENITREEFVKLVVEIADMAGEQATSDFADVNSDAWYENYVAVAQKNGFINGVGNQLFGIGSNITRQDMSKILSDLLIKKQIITDASESLDRFSDALGIAQYAQKAIGVLCANGIISGDENGNFNPENNATRQEAAKLIYKMLELYVIK